MSNTSEVCPAGDGNQRVEACSWSTDRPGTSEHRAHTALRHGPGARGATWAWLLGALLLALLGPGSATEAKDDCVLLVPSSNRYGLESETISCERKGNLTVQAQNLIQSLLSNLQSGRVPLYPQGVGLRRIFVDRSGMAFLDLNKTGADTLGAAEEYLGLMALINTLCLNFNEIKTVKILVNGDEALTLFGHVDLSRPLLPDQDLVE
jgi:hypothetical protein